MNKIALLFTIVCASRLYGMEPQPTYHTLPKELQKEIIDTTLATSKNVDDAVNGIKALGALHGVHYSTQAAIDLLVKTLPNDRKEAINAVKNLQGTTPEDFTKLVHILADRFDIPTEQVVKKFNTPAATAYTFLNDKSLALMQVFSTPQNNTKKVKDTIHRAFTFLINQGLDVNATSHNKFSLLMSAAVCTQSQIVALLLENGADPFLKDTVGDTALSLTGYLSNDPEKEEVETLLRDAMNKQSQQHSLSH